MSNMEADTFGKLPLGVAALKKFGDTPEGFRIYCAGWLGDKPGEWQIMEVLGAEFRKAKTGKNSGKLSVMVPGTKRKVYVTREEIHAAETIEAVG